jgi:hypothetical protein
MIVPKERVLVRGKAEDSYGLPERDAKEICAMKTADSSCNWVQDRVTHALKLANAKVVRALVETETNVHRLDLALKIATMQGLWFN